MPYRKKIPQEIADLYRFYGKEKNKALYSFIAGYYKSPNSAGKIVFITKIANKLKGPFSIAISRANDIMKIIDKYNAYNPLIIDDEKDTDIDFNDKEFHWL